MKSIKTLLLLTCLLVLAIATNDVSSINYELPTPRHNEMSD